VARRALTAAQAVSDTQSLDLTKYARLRPTIVAPYAKLRRYSVSSEKQSLGSYVVGADTTYSWPGLGSGELPDTSYAKIYVEGGLLRFWSKVVGVSGTAIPTSSPANTVRASAFVFQTANGTSRTAAFGDRDVTVGDVVDLSAVVSSVVVSHRSKVTGFVADTTAASIGSAVAASTNAAAQSAAGPTITQVAGTPLNYVASAAGGTYNSAADGGISRVYTVTVTQSSTAGSAPTARLRVRSSDGLDDADNVVPSAFGATTAIGTKGILITLSIDNGRPVDSGVSSSDLIAGQSWTVSVAQAYVVPTATSGGTYTGTVNRTYIVTVSTGGTLASGTAKITCTTASGTDSSGPTTVTGASTAIAVGNYGATITFTGSGASLKKGDVFSFAAVAPAAGAVRTLVLQDDVPAALRTVDCNITVSIPINAVELPVARPTSTLNWSVSSSNIVIKANAAMTVSGLTSSGVAVYAPLTEGTLYAHYRAWSAGSAKVFRVATAADAEANVGPIHPDNPLGYAVGKALENTATSLLGSNASSNAAGNTDIVLAVPVNGDPALSASWTTTLNGIANESDAHTLVIHSDAAAVHQVAKTHVEARSTAQLGFYRTALCVASVAEPVSLLSGTATVTSGTGGNTLVTATGTTFVTSGVRAGDTFRCNYTTDDAGNPLYQSYTVASVASETTLSLVTGPTSQIPVAAAFQLWRSPTSDEVVTQLTSAAAALASTRVSLVWPDTAVDTDGTTVSGGAVAAAVAGLSGSVESHQGLRGIGITGFTSAPRTIPKFTDTQLDALAAGGVFVVSQDPSGGLFVRNASTTDTSSVSNAEESVTRNSDCVRLAIDEAWSDLRGVANVGPGIEQFLRARLEAVKSEFRARNQISRLGAPFTDLVYVSSASVSGRPDALLISVNMVGGPVPLNATMLSLALI